VGESNWRTIGARLTKIACVSDCGSSFVQQWVDWFNGTFVTFDEIKKNPRMLKGYDLLLTYFMGGGWLEIPRWKTINPQLKITLQTDADWWWLPTTGWLAPGTVHDLSSEEILAIRNSDLTIHTNIGTQEYMKDKNLIGDLFFSLVPVYGFPEQSIKSFKERKANNKAAILCHSFSNYSPAKNLMTCRKLRMEPYLIGTYQNELILKGHLNEGGYPQYSRESNPIHYHSRFENQQNYANAINGCLIGLEDSYAGCSRFTIESAMTGLPVFASNYAMSAVILNPDFTAPNGEVHKLIPKIQELVSDEDKYTKLCIETQRKAIDYFSIDTTKNRMVEKIKQYTGLDIL
jgi:hypothetical protein